MDVMNIHLVPPNDGNALLLWPLPDDVIHFQMYTLVVWLYVLHISGARRYSHVALGQPWAEAVHQWQARALIFEHPLQVPHSKGQCLQGDAAAQEDAAVALRKQSTRVALGRGQGLRPGRPPGALDRHRQADAAHYLLQAQVINP